MKISGQKEKKVNNGFTLIELLVVIAIIAILAAVSMFGLGGIFETSRDTQRKSDLKQYQTALENFANKNNGIYPIHATNVGAASVLCSDLQLNNCPEDPNYDPVAGSPKYNYVSDATGTKYVLYTTLENPTNELMSTFEVCSTGISGEQCGVPAGGICQVGLTCN